MSRSFPPDEIATLAPPAHSPMRRKDFLFGVATASYQIEGATQADGRLASIWDTFSRTPGKVLNGDTGDVACDHYQRWSEDIDLIADLGVDGYRLSIAWPRVMDERGQPNQKGLDFYRRLLDKLADKGLQRFVTLYHWDLPQHLEDQGGWLHRDTAYRFAEYADLMTRALQGRVTSWATLNEPWCSAYLGYGNGHHAPGLAEPRHAMQALHHLLLAHGKAVEVIRRNDPGALVGIVANVGATQPASDSAADRAAAELADVFQTGWVLDPLLKGRHAEAMNRLWPGCEPQVRPGDMQAIKAPLDFLGINFYSRLTAQGDGAHGFTPVDLPGVERTQMGWEVYPEGLEHLLRRFQRDYPGLPPIYITENGMASDDQVVDGAVADPHRISYLNRHFAAVSRAMQAGVDVRGYFVWSLMDNYEWSFGYERRFGLVHVDYATQVRTPKLSANLFREYLHSRR
jgi:beta-glucosidase